MRVRVWLRVPRAAAAGDSSGVPGGPEEASFEGPAAGGVLAAADAWLAARRGS